MSLKPVLHRVFVQPNDPQEADDRIRQARATGLIVELDKREQKAVTTGVVVAIGYTAFNEFGSDSDLESIEVGSQVLYAKYAGAEVPNETFLVLNDEDIIGVYTDD